MDCGFIVLLCLVLAADSSYGSVRQYFRRRRIEKSGARSASAGRPKRLPPRPSQSSGSRLLGSRYLRAIPIVIFFALGDMHLSDVGFKANVHPVIALGLGGAAFLLLDAALARVAKRAGYLDKLQDANVEAIRSFWPRERGQKTLAVVAICVFNPVTEEFIYRGVLVYMVGSMIGSFVATVSVGFLLNLLTHLYQGRVPMISQMLFYALAVSLLFSPLGLAGAVGLHVVGDLVPMVYFPRQIRPWADRRRRRRQQLDDQT